MAKEIMVWAFRRMIVYVAIIAATVVVIFQEAVSAQPLSQEREHALKPKDIFKECSNCPDMVVIRAGKFLMGSPADKKESFDNEGPQHRVTIAKPFAVSKFEVTFDEWDGCLADGGCNGYKPNDEDWGRGRRPVINVSWNDAQQYVTWLSMHTGRQYRLLSEAEWEYAARAGGQAVYSWGDKIGKGNATCIGCDSKWDGKQTAPVGSFAANVFGLHDMLGNVSEWVQDCNNNNHNRAPIDGSARTSDDCSRHVFRGGSWNDEPIYLRSAFRASFPSEYRVHYLGFRVARILCP